MVAARSPRAGRPAPIRPVHTTEGHSDRRYNRARQGKDSSQLLPQGRRAADETDHPERTTHMPKRAFERSGGILRDQFADPQGRAYSLVARAALAGEPLRDADRANGLNDIISDDSAVQFRGVSCLAGDRSAEHRERLLAALEAGSAAAPSALLPFIEDRRVRPALVAATRRAPIRDLANFAQAVAFAGGEGAIEILRDRLEELLHAPRAFDDDPFFNPVAGSLVTVAGGLLRLRSDEEKAAAVLVRIVREHPCGFNRRSAAYEACEALEAVKSAQAVRALQSVLSDQLATDDPEMFAIVAPTLASARPDQVFVRCQELLADASSQIRMGVIMALRKIENPRAKALLLEHIPREPWLRTAADMAAHLREGAPASLRADIARRALEDDSPSLRRGGVALLRDLDPETARGLAGAALTDEPRMSRRS